MKLAELLLNRAETQNKIKELQQTIRDNALIQDGDTPSENCQELYENLLDCYETLSRLTTVINNLNNSTVFVSENSRYKGWHLCNALTMREFLDKQIKDLASLLPNFNVKQNMYSKSEIKFVQTMKPTVIKNSIESLKLQRKELDREIQTQNWQINVQV